MMISKPSYRDTWNFYVEDSNIDDVPVFEAFFPGERGQRWDIVVSRSKYGRRQYIICKVDLRLYDYHLLEKDGCLKKYTPPERQNEIESFLRFDSVNIDSRLFKEYFCYLENCINSEFDASRYYYSIYDPQLQSCCDPITMKRQGKLLRISTLHSTYRGNLDHHDEVEVVEVETGRQFWQPIEDRQTFEFDNVKVIFQKKYYVNGLREIIDDLRRLCEISIATGLSIQTNLERDKAHEQERWFPALR
ncbi:MAG: hypothetical protein P8Y42_10630 [Exilibacterium sp.]